MALSAASKSAPSNEGGSESNGRWQVGEDGSNGSGVAQRRGDNGGVTGARAGFYPVSSAA